MDWFGSAVAWVGALAGLSVVVGIIFAAGQWKGRVDSDRDTFRSTLKEIRDDIKRIFQLLPRETIGGSSPLQLTDLGRSISQTLDAAQWAENTSRRLAGRTEGQSPYDIQSMAFDYVEKEFEPDGDMESQIKQCAYENGLRRKQVLDVLAIELRDALLALRSSPA